MGISCILYLRGIFPQEAFKDTELRGIMVRRLDPEKCVEARLWQSFMEDGLLAAVRKNSLTQAEFILSSPMGGPMVERYTFSFVPDGLTVQGVAVREADSARAVKSMLQKLVMTTDMLGRLEEGTVMSIRLHYRSTIPEEYEPRWFISGGKALEFDQDNVAPVDAHLGMVNTATGPLELLFQARPEMLRPIFDEDEENDDRHSHSSCSNNDSDSSSYETRKRLLQSDDMDDDDFEIHDSLDTGKHFHSPVATPRKKHHLVSE